MCMTAMPPENVVVQVWCRPRPLSGYMGVIVLRLIRASWRKIRLRLYHRISASDD